MFQLKLSLATVACLVVIASAYYGGDSYGHQPSYSYDYDNSYSDGYSPASYDYEQGYGDHGNGGYAQEHDDEPVYGGEHGNDVENYYDGNHRQSNSHASYGRRSYGVRRSSSRRDYDDYAPRRSGYGRRNRMDRYGRSGTYGFERKPKPYVPVIIKKKKEKKRKVISVHSGFYVPGGTAIYGKFKDLKSCEKACELTPTCFGGDFNPWLNKCYLHSNLTACQSMKSHKQITHFKKIPCSVVETPRSLITLGAAIWRGLKQKGIDNLMDCVKACSTAGGGIAPQPSTAAATPQICFGVDYDFADHTCYFHVDIAVCGGIADANAIPLTPVNIFAQPSSVNILICPIAPQ